MCFGRKITNKMVILFMEKWEKGGRGREIEREKKKLEEEEERK